MFTIYSLSSYYNVVCKIPMTTHFAKLHLKKILIDHELTIRTKR